MTMGPVILRIKFSLSTNTIASVKRTKTRNLRVKPLIGAKMISVDSLRITTHSG
jgi:hypothetical protein